MGKIALLYRSSSRGHTYCEIWEYDEDQPLFWHMVGENNGDLDSAPLPVEVFDSYAENFGQRKEFVSEQRKERRREHQG